MSSKKTWANYGLFYVSVLEKTNVFRLPISIIMFVRMPVLYLIIIIKSEVWIICHRLGSGHAGTILCAACLSIFSWFRYEEVGLMYMIWHIWYSQTGIHRSRSKLLKCIHKILYILIHNKSWPNIPTLLALSWGTILWLPDHYYAIHAWDLRWLGILESRLWGNIVS